MSRQPALGSFLGLLLVLLSGLVSSNAWSHTRSQSLSDWKPGEQKGELVGRFSIDAYRATLLYADAGAASPPLPELLARHLAQEISAEQAGEPCLLQSSEPASAPAGFLAVKLRLQCPQPIGGVPVQLRIDALFRYAASHVHILRYQTANGDVLEQVLNPERNTARLQAAASERRMLALVPVGATHVLLGPDHLAFVLALLLAIRGWRALLATITAFTLGHSVTLVAATAGWITPASAAVEMLIGFSIALASLEAARHHGWAAHSSRRVALAALVPALMLGAGASAVLAVACGLLTLALSLRQWPVAAMALGFGLIHGAGFAGAYADLLSGQRPHWAPLLGFNLGVELGQILVIALAYGLAWIARRVLTMAQQRQAIQQTLAALLALGVFWTLTRAA